MANMCSNAICFCSTNKEVLARLLDIVEDGDSYRDLFKKHGYSENEAQEHADGRDYITYCDDEITERDGYYYFRVDTETAWDTHIETFHFLLKQEYNNEIFAYYVSEEPGLGVFVTNDSEKLFFDDRYRISNCETLYFGNKQDMVDFVRERTGVAVSIIDPVAKMEKMIRAKMEQDESKCCCFINKFEIDTYG